MSIEAEIAARMAEGRLYPLQPFMPTDPAMRRIYATSSVKAVLDGPWSVRGYDRRAGMARALLEGFVRGDTMVVRMPPSKDVHTVIALLDPATNNVWEFRIGNPRPGVRILGRFAAPDIFIATNWVNREDFTDPRTRKDDPRRWRNEVVRSKAIWVQLFPSFDPFIGSTHHDFISNSRLPV